jgi:hypothetical protein
MDVYRMAGMRAEFENVARNLNMHFNVEVQSWDDGLMATGVPLRTMPVHCQLLLGQHAWRICLV